MNRKQTLNEEFGKLGTSAVTDYQQLSIDDLTRRLEEVRASRAALSVGCGGGKTVLAQQLIDAAKKCGYIEIRHPTQRYSMLYRPEMAEAMAAEGFAGLERLRKMLDDNRAQAAAIANLTPRQRRHYSFLMNSTFGKGGQTRCTHEYAIAAAREIKG